MMANPPLPRSGHRAGRQVCDVIPNESGYSCGSDSADHPGVDFSEHEGDPHVLLAVLS